MKSDSVPPLPARIGSALLIVLALVLPFEAALAHVGSLQLTTVELTLYAALAAWGLVTADDVLRGRTSPRSAARVLLREPLVSATTFWTVVVFASAIAAPLYRHEALKFALRSLSGVLVFFAARRLTRSPEVARRVTFALLVGASLSATTALIETAFPASERVWGLFRELSFDTFGLRRASGVFVYPTIGAMYWEAAVPLALVAPFLSGEAHPSKARRRVVIAVATSTLLFAAIVASATRSSMAGSALACLALFACVRAWSDSLGRAAVYALVMLTGTSAVAVALPGAGSLLGQRLRWWRDDTWFGVQYDAPSTPRTVEAAWFFATPVTLRNTGTLTWQRGGPHPTRLASHWYMDDADPHMRRLADFDGRRTELPADVPPGGEVTLAAVAHAPASVGSYRLAWDVVQEDVTWFSEHGNPSPEQPIEVERTSGGDTSIAPAEVAHVSPGPPAPSRPELWRAAVVLWREHPALGIGPDNFRRRYEDVLSPTGAREGQAYTDARIHANSLYFETLADLGAFGALALLGLAVSLALATRDAIRKKDALYLGLSFAAGLFFVHGASDYFLEFTPTFGLCWMLLGLVAARAAPGDSPE